MPAPAPESLVATLMTRLTKPSPKILHAVRGRRRRLPRAARPRHSLLLLCLLRWIFSRESSYLVRAGTRGGFEETSLRRHYPDQVQRVGARVSPPRPLSLSAPRLLSCAKVNPSAPYAQPPLAPLPTAPQTINSPSAVVAAVISPATTFPTASASGTSTTYTNSVGSGCGPA